MLTIPAMADRVRELTTSTGTGTVTLGGAVAGYSSFATAFPTSSTQVFYCIADVIPGSWEVGIGTFTLSGGTLSRTTVISSSNSNALVSFAAGNKDVFVTMPASKLQALTQFTAGSSPPAGPGTGDQWLDTSDGTVYTYYNDGSSSQWVDLNGTSIAAVRPVIPTYFSASQPSDQGQYIWVQTGLGDDGSGMTVWFNV